MSELASCPVQHLPVPPLPCPPFTALCSFCLPFILFLMCFCPFLSSLWSLFSLFLTDPMAFSYPCCEWNTSTWLCSQGLPWTKGLPAHSYWESKGSTSSAVSNFQNVQLCFSEVLSWKILPRSLKWTGFEGYVWLNPLWWGAVKPFGTI